MNAAYNMDCMEYMKTLPDKAFELAIVDPPYGIGISSNPVRQAHTKNSLSEHRICHRRQTSYDDTWSLWYRKSLGSRVCR